MGLPPHLRAAQAARLLSLANKPNTISDQTESTSATTSSGRLSVPAQAMSLIAAALSDQSRKVADGCSSAESSNADDGRSFAESTTADDGHSPDSASPHQGPTADNVVLSHQAPASPTQHALSVSPSDVNLRDSQCNAPSSSQARHKKEHLEQENAPSDHSLVPYSDTQSSASSSGGRLEQLAVSPPIASPWLGSGGENSAYEPTPIESDSADRTVADKLDIMTQIVVGLDARLQQLTEQNKRQSERAKWLEATVKSQIERLAELEARMGVHDSLIAHGPSSSKTNDRMSEMANQAESMEDRLHALGLEVIDTKTELMLLRSELMVMAKSMKVLVQSQIKAEPKPHPNSTAEGQS